MTDEKENIKRKMKNVADDDLKTYLIKIEGKNKTETDIIQFNDQQFLIGRNSQADHIIYDAVISRKHCIFKNNNGQWHLEILGQFGVLVNDEMIEKNDSVVLKHGDTVVMDYNTRKYVYKFCNTDYIPPPKKKTKLNDSNKADEQQKYMQNKIDAAKFEQSQMEAEKIELKTNYEKKIEELEANYKNQKEIMASKSVANEEEKKLLEIEIQGLEKRLLGEKQKLESDFENEKQDLQLKIDEQIKVGEQLKQENEKLLRQINKEREEFELKLLEERRELEALKAEAERKANEEKAELQRQLNEHMEEMKAKQEEENLEKEKLKEEHDKIVQQLKEKEEFEAQKVSEHEIMKAKMEEMKQALEKQENENKKLNEELIRKELEKAEELEKMRQLQEEEFQRMKEDMTVKEIQLRSDLDKKIDTLQSEKLKLEADIRLEMNVQNIEKSVEYEAELQKVKKQLELMEVKKEVLEKELAENNQKEKITEECLKTKKECLENVEDVMNAELQCTICSELFITPTMLNCSHTFCKYCIDEWKKSKGHVNVTCPTCRALVRSETRALALDNYIERMIERLSDSLKNERKELVASRNRIKANAASTSGNAPPANPIRVDPDRSVWIVEPHMRAIGNVGFIGDIVPNMPFPVIPAQQQQQGRPVVRVRGGRARQHRGAPQPIIEGPRLQTVVQQPQPTLQPQPNPNLAMGLRQMLNAVYTSRHPIHSTSTSGPSINNPVIVATTSAPTPVASTARSSTNNTARVAVTTAPPPVASTARSATNNTARVATTTVPPPLVPSTIRLASSSVTGSSSAQPANAPHRRSTTLPPMRMSARPQPPQGPNRPGTSNAAQNNLDESVLVLENLGGDSSSDDDSLIVHGEEGVYYGGYGKCFSCGMSGHWVGGCPFRRRND